MTMRAGAVFCNFEDLFHHTASRDNSFAFPVMPLRVVIRRKHMMKTCMHDHKFRSMIIDIWHSWLFRFQILKYFPLLKQIMNRIDTCPPWEATIRKLCWILVISEGGNPGLIFPFSGFIEIFSWNCSSMLFLQSY